jgi:hypothetical protein
MPQDYHLSCLQRNHGRNNYGIYPCNISLGHTLSDIFDTNRQAVLDTVILTTVPTVYLIWE